MNTITINRTCPFCHKTYNMVFDREVIERGYKAYQEGALLQDAFPTLTPSEREFLKTGICDECWDKM